VPSVDATTESSLEALPAREDSIQEETTCPLGGSAFGPSRCRKDVALSVAYPAESCDGLEVTVRDEEMFRYLRPLAETLIR
jgi:hypothetical protein